MVILRLSVRATPLTPLGFDPPDTEWSIYDRLYVLGAHTLDATL